MKNVVIIGAGPAGLTAAYQLLKDNKDVQIIVIEQSNQVGGISKTIEYKGNHIDLGGHRFFSKNKFINDIWLDLLKLQGQPIDSSIEKPQNCLYTGTADPNDNDNVMLLRRRVSRIYYKGNFYNYPISLNLETIKNLGFFTSLKCGFGYFWSCIFKQKGKSLEDFYINRFGKPLYKLFFEGYTTKLWGVPPSKLDSKWGSQRVKELSISKMIFEFFAKKHNKDYKTRNTSLIEQFYYPKYGPGQLWEEMAKRIETAGGLVLYNTICKKINVENGCISSVEIENKSGKANTIKCDFLISSTSISELITMLNDIIPHNIKIVSNKLPYRDFVTVGLLVNKLAIKNTTTMNTTNDIPPDCWIYVQDNSVKVGRIQIFNNWSPFLVARPKDTVWIGLEYFCFENDELWNLSDEKFSEFAIEELTKIGIIDKNQVLDYVVLKEKKAYPAYYGSYSNFDVVKDYLKNYHNLICVGRNGQHRYNNMDHSMLTGILASRYINGLATIDDVWNVNSEQEYHENGAG
ncbi:MAG: NAD(P)/FAD-dependent oxidoreductase [Clostridia bacterium]|nr:NAD(P)/FAD-dependent oxidoreductase [Clostridia bacterium]